jgi:hypothetical protein
VKRKHVFCDSLALDQVLKESGFPGGGNGSERKACRGSTSLYSGNTYEKIVKLTEYTGRGTTFEQGCKLWRDEVD